MRRLATVPVEARLYMRDLSGTPHVVPGVRLVARSYSKHARFGPHDAEIEAYGSEAALVSLLSVLRCPLELWASGEIVWWGFVHAVEVRTSRAKRGVSLETMFNSVRVAYTVKATPAAPAGERRTTEAAENALSIATYGRRELLATLAEASDAEAQQERDRILAQRQYPVHVTSPVDRDGALGATLTCRGWGDTLAWRRYALDEGLFGYEDTSDYDKLWTMAVGQEWYQNTTIGFVAVEDQMAVEDSSHTLAFQPRSHVVMWHDAASFGKYLLASRKDDGGQFLLANPENAYSLTTEAAGATASLHPYGEAITFSFSHSYDRPIYLHRIRLQVAKEGAALADAMQVELHSDSGGSPVGNPQAGTELEKATLAHTDLATSFAWGEFVFGDVTALQPDTRYWFIVTRSVNTPATDGVNFYLTQINELAGYEDPGGLGGALKVWHTQNESGSSYGWEAYSVPHANDADLLFVLEGSRETTIQITDIVASHAQFLTGTFVQHASGVYSCPQRAGDYTAQQEVEQLLDSGVVVGGATRRLLGEITPQRVLWVRREPAPGEADWLGFADGGYHDPYDVPVPPYRCPVGMWVRPADTFVGGSGGLLGGGGRVFVERMSYDVASGRLRPEPRDLPSIWNVGGVYDY